jgi:predicted nucleotidyltransferase
MAIDVRSRLHMTDEQLAAFCRKWKLTRVELFGSILRDDFDPGTSDIDLLFDYEANSGLSLFDVVHMQDELSSLLGRKVDLVSRRAIQHGRNRLRRDHILSTARVIYGG